MPFVVKKQSNQTTESTKDTKMKISENFVTSVPFVVKKEHQQSPLLLCSKFSLQLHREEIVE